MQTTHLAKLLIAFALLLQLNLHAQVLDLDDVKGVKYPNNWVKIYLRGTMQDKIGEIALLPESKWQDFDPKMELFPTESYWFKISLKANDLKTKWLITPGLWHYSQLYSLDRDRQWRAHNMSVFQPLPKREIKHQFPFFQIKSAKQPQTIYIKSKGFRYGRSADSQHVWLIPKKLLNQKVQNGLHFQGVYLGFALGLAGFHLVLWFWFREKTYLWLVASAMVSPIFYYALYGFGLIQFWPTHPVWNEYSASILGSIAVAVYLRFGVCYLNLSVQMPRVEKLVTALLYLSLFAGLAVFQQTKWLLDFSPVILIVTTLIILWSSVKLVTKKIRYAWYFIAGNGFVLFSFVLWGMLQLGMITQQNLPLPIQELTQMASGIQGISLALGMIDRMQNMKQTILENKLKQEQLIRKQAEQTQRLMQVQNAELASANYALKEVDQLKDEFLAKTSHELNTPLNGIIGLTEILLDKQSSFSKSEEKEYLELIASRGEHLRELVVELLEFAQTRRDVVKLYPEQIDAGSQIKKIVMSFQPIAAKKRIDILFDDDQHGSVFVDARRFRQIISILVDNAIKYTDTGAISIRLSNSENDTAIEISDTGIGISEDDLANIFEPFRQVVDTNRVTEGAGLGLSICKHLVELHDGNISLQSQLGRGTKFTINLPKEQLASTS